MNRDWQNWTTPVIRALEKDWESSMHKRKTLYKTLEMLPNENVKTYKEVMGATFTNLSTILDAGAGIGQDYPKLKELGYDYTGIDVTSEMVEYARKKHPDGRFDVGDIYNLPFNDQQFDVVLCHDVLIHIPDFEKALAELWRVTKKFLVIKISYAVLFPTRYIRDHALNILNIHYNVAEFELAMWNLIGAKNVVLIDVEDDEISGGFDNHQIFVAVRSEKSFKDVKA